LVGCSATPTNWIVPRFVLRLFHSIEPTFAFSSRQIPPSLPSSRRPSAANVSAW
jgi:hypothetical protein